MSKRFFIFFLSIHFAACDPRSGVSHEVEDEDSQIIQKLSEREQRELVSQANGEKLFTGYCRKCHVLDRDVKCANELRGLRKRIPGDDWFKRFVRSSDSLKKSSEPYSLMIDQRFQSDYEHAFKMLSDQEIVDIYNYLELW